MPRLTPQVWDQRRRHVLESAWRCFARSGFHATTMDDVIAESGWSPSVVYRYVRGKEELIDAASAEAFHELKALTRGLVEADPMPTPREVVGAFVGLLDDERHGRRYSLAGLVMHTWAEAFDNPLVADRGRASWDEAIQDFSVVAGSWRERGLLPVGLQVADVAAAMTLIAPGVVVDDTFLRGRGTTGLLRLLGAWAR